MATATAERETSHGLVIERITKHEQEGLDVFSDLEVDRGTVSVFSPKGSRVNAFVVGSVMGVVSKCPGATKYAIDFDMGDDIAHVDHRYLKKRLSEAAITGELPAGLYLHEMDLSCKPGKNRLSLVFKYI